jgi:hypothetical protein
MAEEKGIQISKHSNGIQISKEDRETKKNSYKYDIEISRTGKPVNGSIPELVELDFRCGTTRKDFQVIIEGERTSHGIWYKVTNIRKTDSHPHEHKTSSETKKQLNINIEEIKGISTIQCPYCRGGKSAIIKCDCEGLSCGGGVKQEGDRTYHECPWCHSVGVISGHIESLSGERSTSHQIYENRTSNSQMIPRDNDPNVKLLSGNKQIQKKK